MPGMRTTPCGTASKQRVMPGMRTTPCGTAAEQRQRRRPLCATLHKLPWPLRADWQSACLDLGRLIHAQGLQFHADAFVLIHGEIVTAWRGSRCNCKGPLLHTAGPAAQRRPIQLHPAPADAACSLYGASAMAL
eukprot:361200-Chlamydomonas_euryale.AAC.26